MIHFVDYNIEVYVGSAWTALNKNAMTDVSSSLSISANSANPLAPGDDSSASAEFTILRSAATFAWLHTPVRMTFTMDGASGYTFVGVITERSSDGLTRTFRCRGLDELVRTTRLHSPLFENRPVATTTTLTSVDDPSAPGWQAGVINWILWQCGGRPLQQASAYPSAVFYYDFDASVLDTRYAWVSGDDAWQEAQKLCSASGGRLYQAEDGTLVYRSPLRLNSTPTGATLTSDTFERIEEEESADQVCATVIVPYTRRYLLSSQEVLNDTVPRVICAGESITVELTPKWPVSRYDSFNLTVTDALGLQLPNDGSGYTYTATAMAQLVTLVITNHRSTPVTLRKIIAIGAPLAPGEAAEARVGSGKPERSLQANEFIQTEQHASRLATLLLDLYAATPTRTLSGVVYDSSVHLGDIKAITDADFGLVATPHLLVSRSDEGETVAYKAVSTAHLPRLEDLMAIDTVYADTSVTRKLSY